MTKNELMEYLEQNLSNYTLFLSKALEYQQEKNKRRPSKKRWADEKMERAADNMWKDFASSVYEKVKTGYKSDTSVSSYPAFIEKNEMLESLNDAIGELEFE